MCDTGHESGRVGLRYSAFLYCRHFLSKLTVHTKKKHEFWSRVVDSFSPNESEDLFRAFFSVMLLLIPGKRQNLEKYLFVSLCFVLRPER